MVIVVVADFGVGATIGGTALGEEQLVSMSKENDVNKVAKNIRADRRRRLLMPAPAKMSPQRTMLEFAHPREWWAGDGRAGRRALTEASEV